MVPGSWLATNCQRKLSGDFIFENAFDGNQYWLPIMLDRLPHAGCSKSCALLPGVASGRGPT